MTVGVESEIVAPEQYGPPLLALGVAGVGLTTTLVVLFDFGMEIFAFPVKGFWLWLPSKLPFDWYNVPVSNFVGWTAATLKVRVYEALQRWRDLLSAQTRLAELESETSTKAELYRLVARRWLDQFSNVQNAVEAMSS